MRSVLWRRYGVTPALKAARIAFGFPSVCGANDRLGLRLAKERASRSLKGGAIRLASQKPMLGSPTGQADRYGYLVRQLYFFQSGSRSGPQEAVMHKIVFAESKRCTG